MPLGGNVRYRVTRRGGKKVRLAFRGGKVVEAKNLDTGAIHTEREFTRDRKLKAKRAKLKKRLGKLKSRRRR